MKASTIPGRSAASVSIRASVQASRVSSVMAVKSPESHSPYRSPYIQYRTGFYQKTGSDDGIPSLVFTNSINGVREH